MSFCYAAPASLSEALAFLAERGPDSSILAGGMSVVPALKKGLLSCKFIVNIKGIGGSSAPELDAANAQLTIGALVRHREIETSPLIAEYLPALRALEERLASVQIRNHGTLIGNLCAAEPWSDPPCLLAALDASLVVVAERGERRVSAADWIAGEGETLRQPDELLLRIELPLAKANVGVGYARVAARQGLARPLACAAARIALSEGGNVTTARVFIGAVGPRPQRITDVEAMLAGHRPNGELSAEIEHAVSRVIERHPDERCGACYKTQVAGVLVRRAIADAVEHARAWRVAP
jgi:aerobic carbon-monoxide dehydrogenase medium subunit